MQHVIRLTGEREYLVTGAVSLTSRQPVVDAVKALVESGNAKPSDTIRVNWAEGTPFTVRVNRLLDYRPSDARRAVDRSGALHHHFGKEFAQARAAYPAHA